MTTKTNRLQHDQPPHEGLHPLVYRGMIGLAVWFVLSIWVFFSRGAYVVLSLAMISAFFLIIVAIPLILSVTWQHNADLEATRTRAESFRDWKAEDFATWTGRVSGREAATQILLPLAAVAIGISVFGLVFYLDVPHAGY